MTVLNLRDLVVKLGARGRSALERATSLCVSRTNYNIEIEHILISILDNSHADMCFILNYYQVDQERLQLDIQKAIDRLRTGNVKTPGFSQDVIVWFQSAWLIASLDCSMGQVTTAHLLAALIVDEALARIARDISLEFAKIPAEDLKQNIANLVEQCAQQAGSNEAAERQQETGVAATAKQQALNQFTIDLTEQARQGKIDPVMGRDAEIRQIIDILTRRRQNNPILTGEAGVGKTAVVEGFALRIANGDVPKSLRAVSLRVLDLALLQAGAGVKGEFENRLKSIINEVKQSPQPIILFIDEAHSMIGAGGSEGQGDAANLLKPALARGELRTIAATTWGEYKKYFEKDAALARRFQVVKIEEPTETQAISMMRGVAKFLEQHHQVRILDAAVEAAVRLSNRYISGRQLPDKAVSLLDTACAKVAMGFNTTPELLENCQRQREQNAIEQVVLKRESMTGFDHAQRLQELQQQAEQLESTEQQLNQRYQSEQKMVSDIQALREKLEQEQFADEEERLELLQQLQQITVELQQSEAEQPLMHVCVDEEIVAQIVASWTGIPVGKMMRDEIDAVLEIQTALAKRVIGQDHALQRIAETIQVSRASLADPGKPVGVFMLAGTSGTGKTETALALAELLYGGEQNLTVINMSEFKEEHKVSMLVGSPPGYVGYGEGGVLTNAVRRRPYSVILLDEIEKAHPGVQEVFYQVFDKGMIMDGEGREIDFKNTVIIMTTNAGTQSLMKAYSDEDNVPETIQQLDACIRPELLRIFKPAFLGRVQVVPYIPLDESIIKQIARLQLARVAERIQVTYHASMSIDEEVLDVIAARCQEVETGARNIEHLIQRNILPSLSTQCLMYLADDKAIDRVKLAVDDEQQFQIIVDTCVGENGE